MEIVQTEPGVWQITSENITDRSLPDLIIRPPRENTQEFQWLDKGNPDAVEYDFSRDCKWRDVEFELGGQKDIIRASSIEDIRKALHHIDLDSIDIMGI